MKENSGWIKIHRAIKNWEGYPDIRRIGFLVYLLLEANWEDKPWQGIIIKRGSFVTSIEKLCIGTGLNERQTRYLLSVMRIAGELSTKGTNKYTVISINNYDEYQDVCQTSVKQSVRRVSNKVSTTKEDKNIRSKDIYSEIISHYNEITGKKIKTIDEKAVSFWTDQFSLLEIKTAISNLPLMDKEEKDGGFWKGMTLVRFFRTRNANGKPDTIEQALNYQPKKKTLSFNNMEL